VSAGRIILCQLQEQSVVRGGCNGRMVNINTNNRKPLEIHLSAKNSESTASTNSIGPESILVGIASAVKACQSDRASRSVMICNDSHNRRLVL